MSKVWKSLLQNVEKVELSTSCETYLPSLVAAQTLQCCLIEFQVESAITELLGVRSPDSIIKPPEDTTYLLRDYEGKYTDGIAPEFGAPMTSEEAFCGQTLLHTVDDMYLLYPHMTNFKPILLNSNPWVIKYLKFPHIICRL